jgi:CRP-like cAMP-binding protein
MKLSERKVTTNQLVAALPAPVRQQFIKGCELVTLDFADILCESGEEIIYVYFPVDSFISLVTRLDDGSRLEVGIVGDEGMLGMSLILGVKISSEHAVVQGAGSALRMRAGTFSKLCKDNLLLRQAMNRYVYVLIKQLAMTAACTHYHVVESRLARWLLLTRDRAHSDQFRLTHEFLAFMLGVRRVGITEAAKGLYEQGLITYSRGDITILDGKGLENASCRCYRQGNAMYDRSAGVRPKKSRHGSIAKAAP